MSEHNIICIVTLVTSGESTVEVEEVILCFLSGKIWIRSCTSLDVEHDAVIFFRFGALLGFVGILYMMIKLGLVSSNNVR